MSTQVEPASRRVLFVDDEVNVLQGIRRMLRRFRREWDMVFVDGAEPAIAAMRAAPFDVVVSDMRMPGMDGAQLQKLVQDEYPDSIRIILSGHSEAEAVMRSVSTCHQFLSKPCDPDDLRGAIARSFKMRERISDPVLLGVVGRMESLPALPRVYNELTVLLTDPEVEVSALAEVVEQDAGIAAKLLQLVNSSFFGVARNVDTIRDAISFLGINTIKTLVLSYELFEQVDPSKLASSYSLEGAQRHGHLVAAVAREIRGGRGVGDRAFLSGLLHDLGKLVQALNELEAFDRLSAESGAGVERERQLMRASHDVIGAYLLGIWGMPYTVVEAVSGHHDVASHASGALDDVTAVHIADALVHEVEGEAPANPLNAQHVEALGLTGSLPGWREFAEELMLACPLQGS